MFKTILAIIGIVALIAIGLFLLVRRFFSGPWPGPF